MKTNFEDGVMSLDNNQKDLNQVIRQLKEKGIVVEKTKSRKDIWESVSNKAMPNMTLRLQ
ncbi:hypothetical protein LMxysn_0862 [Listeria monocytogenes]|nr:hypothetical protein LMxysn_0862 [Listeria monocytogenes]